MVPDESVVFALRGAAGRGVKVSLIVPEKNDSLITKYASHSYYDDLLDAGVRIFLFQGGLLHTKAVMVDGYMSMFGTVNLDMRSLWLNFELSLFVYDRETTQAIRALQLDYIRRSRPVEPKHCENRPLMQRFLENAAHLLAPLL